MTLKTVFGVGLAAVVIIIAAIVAASIAPFDLTLLAQGHLQDFGAVLAAAALPAALPKDLASLKQLRAAAYTDMEAALEVEGEERQQEFDAAEANVTRLDAAIDNLDRLQKLKGAAAIGQNPGEADGPVVNGFLSKYLRLPPSAHVVEKGKTLSQAQHAAFGDLLFATVRAAKGRGVDPLLIEASLGSNETVAEEGGFLVEKDIADGLLRRTFERAMIASKVRRIPISAKANGLKINALKDDSRVTGARWGGLQTYHIGEGDALTPARPKFRQMNLSLKKMAGLLYATDEILQDSTALAGLIAEAFPDEFAFTLDDVIFEGAGGSTGLGFMAAGCKVTIAKETGQAAKSILFENVAKMAARMPARSVPNSEWWINQDTMPALMGLHQVIGTGGVPVYLPPGGLSGSPFGTLLGRPVIPLEYCNTLGTEGDIVYVDPSSYLMIDKGDIQTASSVHVAFLTNEQAFRFIYRYDGQPVDDKPITPFKGTDKLSTFVTLETRG